MLRRAPFLLFLACAGSAEVGPADPASAPELPLRLRWFPAAEGADPSRGLGAVLWAMSGLGALPAVGTGLTAVQGVTDEVSWELDALDLGLPDLALPAFYAAVDEARASDEYRAFGSYDAGRFLMRTLYEPYRYAAMTGACATIEEWGRADRLHHVESYAVTTSTLTDGERIVILADTPTEAAEIAFVAQELEGTIEPRTFVLGEQETLDLMANGQLRYAVYDVDGNWIPGARTTPAGQPGKCIWCHEYQIQRGTAENASAPGFLIYAEWIERIERQQGTIEGFRASLSTAVPYADVTFHEDAEQLVQNFLWPTPARVAAEWGESESSVVALGLSAYDVEEYGWTDRLARSEVDAAWTGGSPVTVLTDNRELYDGDTLAAAELPPCEGR